MGLLDGKVVLITGGGRGIGKETALIAARQGAKVIVNDLGGDIHGLGADKAPAQGVADEIKAAGGEAVANTESVTDLKAVGRMVQQAMDTYGALHAVSNPAGILRDRMAHNMTEEEWDGIMEVHLRGHFNVVRATINHFRTQQEGNYVMWSSTSGLIGNVGQSNYGAAKMGIAGLSRIIALEGARNNVRANSIAPGAATRMTDSVPRDDAGAARREAMREVQSPVRPAQLAVALLSDAAKHISGQIFGAGGYNLSIYSQPRPIKTYSRDGGWDAEGIVKDFFPRAQPDFTPLDRTAMAAGANAAIPVPAS
ncbi:MAG TPA: SDR family NAD(P)-dependent oxidoreductase [Caulobacteraceae bacterium]|jgi:NAD(P)-dependent dehydrogenase (short-subunit alcohol dehydrogenase family)|nr:SDR family NAD(P)-dependent oxidoreductase [Caulobacteraceae bacterium]